jgi:hypothetical protein
MTPHPRPAAGRYIATALLPWAVVICGHVDVGAHHSFFSVYDRLQPLSLTGTVTKVEWTNPHIHFSLEVKRSNGNVTWVFSGAAASTLARQGLSEMTLKVGDVIKVDGFRAFDGSFTGAAGAVTLPNRKRIFVGPLEEPTPI